MSRGPNKMLMRYKKSDYDSSLEAKVRTIFRFKWTNFVYRKCLFSNSTAEYTHQAKGSCYFYLSNLFVCFLNKLERGCFLTAVKPLIAKDWNHTNLMMFPTINRGSNFCFLIDLNTTQVGAKIFSQILNCPAKVC